MKLGLENIRTLLSALGNPQNGYLKVQVAGTNGKGSVCAFLNSICLEAGVKTGLYTSPHLISITERIRINGADIGEDDFARISTHIRETAEKLLAKGELEYRPTFFEQVTAIALFAFAEAKVELAILETGLGGRLDATTAANAEIAAITRIDYDHQEYLGETIEEIAAEKAAIIRSDSLVCIGRQASAANAVILGKCKEVGVVPKTLDAASWAKNTPGVDFVVDSFKYDEVEVSLVGEHQFENAALAILITQELRQFFPIHDETIFKGLATAQHPGRLEWTEYEEVRVLLDGGHNPSGAEALAQYLNKYQPDAGIALVFGSMEDKDHSAMLEALLPFVKDVILTESGNSRSASASRLADSGILYRVKEKVFMVDDILQAIDSAVQLVKTYPSTRHKFVLVTGSLYLVGEAKKILNN